MTPSTDGPFIVFSPYPHRGPFSSGGHFDHRFGLHLIRKRDILMKPDPILDSERMVLYRRPGNLFNGSRGMRNSRRRKVMTDEDMAEAGPTKVSTLKGLLRPFTLIAPAVGVFSGALLAAHYESYQGLSILPLIFGALSLALMNGASNVYNQITDLDIDRINKPERPLPSGHITIRQTYLVAVVFYVISMVAAAMVNGWFLFFAFILLGITILYSIPGIRLKKRLWVSNVTIAISRGLFGFVAAWSVFADPYHPVPWVCGAIIGLYLMGAATTKDFSDIEGDRTHGMNTLPVRYGIERSIGMITPFFIFPYLLIPVMVAFGVLDVRMLLMTAMALWGYYMARLLKQTTTEHDATFENGPTWKHMYLMLICTQFGFVLSVSIPMA